MSRATHNVTTLGGTGESFPSTRWSMILDARDRESPAHKEAIDHLCRLYWRPVYVYLRKLRSFGNEEAKDATQDFFGEILEGGLLERYSSERGAFRGYLRGAIKLFVLERHQKAAARKRGGGQNPLRLDDSEFREGNALPGSDTLTAEQAYDLQWARSVVGHAVGDLREELIRDEKEHYFRVFERYELNPAGGRPPTYGEVAREFQVGERDVGNYLTECRKRLRRLVRDRVRDYVPAEEDVGAELAGILALLTGGAG